MDNTFWLTLGIMLGMLTMIVVDRIGRPRH